MASLTHIKEITNYTVGNARNIDDGLITEYYPDRGSDKTVLYKTLEHKH